MYNKEKLFTAIRSPSKYQRVLQNLDNPKNGWTLEQG